MGYHPGGTDRDSAAALQSGDPGAAARMYDRYAHGLYGYACGFVDASAASDVVYDSVWIATARISALRDRALIRAWLYAIVRAECVRVLHRNGAAVDFLPASDPAAPVSAGVRAVRESVHRLDGQAREVVDLAVRHHFDSYEITALLGSSTGDGRVLARAQDVVDRSLPGVPNALGSFAALPLPPLPLYLRDRLLAVTPPDNEILVMGRRLDPLNSEGFPRHDRRARRTLPIIAASVAGLVALVVAAAVVLPDSAPAELRDPRPAAESNLDLGSSNPPTTTGTTSVTTEAAITEPAITESTTTEPTTTPDPAPEVTSAPPTVTTTSTVTPSVTSTAPAETTTEPGRYPRRGGSGRDQETRDEETSEEPDPTGTTTRTTATRPTFPGRGT